MNMVLSHQTEADDSLTHQVRITGSNNQIKVSCVCRRTDGVHSKAGKLYYDPIGPTHNLDESRELYNDPENHWAPFDPEEDRAKW